MIKISQRHVTVSLGSGCKSSLKKWDFRVGLKDEQRWPWDDLGLSSLEGGWIGQSCKVGERGGMSVMGIGTEGRKEWVLENRGP